MPVAKSDGLADGARTRVEGVAARHERTLLRVARQASLCHDDALDAYQRALEIFVRRVETVDPATELAWLKVVVYRILGTWARSPSDSTGTCASRTFEGGRATASSARRCSVSGSRLG